MTSQPVQQSPVISSQISKLIVKMYNPQSPPTNPFARGVPAAPANDDDPFAIFTGLQSTGTGNQASSVYLQPPPQASRSRQKKNQNDPFADLLQ